tara:strand:- start:146 stop:337 length:192 start_codon:yes stop_codon:yes gene_type:complete
MDAIAAVGIEAVDEAVVVVIVPITAPGLDAELGLAVELPTGVYGGGGPDGPTPRLMGDAIAPD